MGKAQTILTAPRIWGLEEKWLSGSVGLEELNLQDQRMMDYKKTTDGKCRTWKMTEVGTSKVANNHIQCWVRYSSEVFQIQILIHYHKCILDTDTKNTTLKMYLDTDKIIKVSRYKIHNRYIIA